VEESSGSHPEIPYAVSHEEFNTFKRISRAYSRKIGALPTTPLLPRRRRPVRPVVSTCELTLVHTVKDLVDFSLLKIEEPFDLIPNTPTVTPPASYFSDHQEYSEPEEEESDPES
jgi:hypothetical protein